MNLKKVSLLYNSSVDNPCCVFQTFDRDGNGFIGASDLHNTYLAINENLTDDEVDELIRLVDHDGDGQVRVRVCIRFLSLLRGRSATKSFERWCWTSTRKQEDVKSDRLVRLWIPPPFFSNVKY
eukprot:745924-Hanusia_phi.AAC.1